MTTRRIHLKLDALKESLEDRGYKLDESLLRATIKSIPCFQTASGAYTIQAPSAITTPDAGHPIINSRFDWELGHFFDTAPWDGLRHKFLIGLNGTPSSSIMGLGATFYQLIITTEETNQ